METHSTLIFKVLRQTAEVRSNLVSLNPQEISRAICQICECGELKPQNKVGGIRTAGYICPLCETTYTTFEVEEMNKNHAVLPSQRIIKFRAWDLDAKKIIYDAVQFNNISKEIYITDKSLFKSDANYVWQEYTGIKDITGVEIYEGDIVSYTNNYIKDVTINLVVKFRDGGFKLWWKTSDYYFDIDKGTVRVVGHIFDRETPKVT